MFHYFDRDTSTEYSSPRPITAAYMQNIPHPDQSDSHHELAVLGMPPGGSGYLASGRRFPSMRKFFGTLMVSSMTEGA
eukprot:1195593-Prorocentrum_minimum.AAC.6